MSTGGVLLLACELLCWLLLVAVLFSVVGVEAIGDRDIFLGLRWLLAGVLVCAVWSSLGALLLGARGKGMFPGWVGTAAPVLVLASAAAAVASLYMVNGTEMRWPLVLLAVPPVVSAYLVLLYRASSAGRLAAAGHLAVWGVVAVATVAVACGFLWWKDAPAINRALGAKHYAAYLAGQRERIREQNLAKLRSLSPDAGLPFWFSLLDRDSGVRREAIDALRKGPNRQYDIEQRLRDGVPGMMYLVPEFDLEPTPGLCEAAIRALAETAKDLEFGIRVPLPYAKHPEIEESLATVRWLSARGCDCAEGLAAIERAAGRYLDSPDRRELLSELARLRQPR